eukprot:2188322-Amphidinium_carterae.1
MPRPERKRVPVNLHVCPTCEGLPKNMHMRQVRILKSGSNDSALQSGHTLSDKERRVPCKTLQELSG